MTEFGARLRRLRESRGMSLAALAGEVHFTKGYLSKIENGRSRPNPSLAQSCDRVLGAGGELLGMLAEDAEPDHRPPTCLIPPPELHFTGRAAELSTVASMLGPQSTARICVISGLAGAGKTALAVRAARAARDDFPDGCLAVDLRGHTPGAEQAGAGEVAGRLLGMLGVEAGRVPGDAEGRTALLRAVLRDRKVLLLLDNARTAAQVRPLAPDGSGSRVLVTSRTRLPALDDAWHLPLGMLSEAEAVLLFRAVAGSSAPDDHAAVAEITRRCGRLPLAVRIAAARFAAGGWTAERFLARLTRESTLLGALDDGERGVATAFAVTHDDLPDEPRRLLGLLALHPAGVVSTAAVEAMGGVGEGEADAALDRLHDAHLVTRDEDGDLRVHDLVRAFAVRHALPALAPAVRAAATDRLVDLLLGTVHAADELLDPHRYRTDSDAARPARLPFCDADTALAWLRAHWPAAVGAVELAAGDRRSWRLALLLRAFFFHDKLFAPWIATHQVALTAARDLGDQAATGRLLNNLGMAHVEQGDADTAAECHRAARTAFAEAADHNGEVDALSSLAWANLYRGDAASAARDLEATLTATRRTGRTRNTMIALRGLALAHTALGDTDQALTHASEAHELAQQPVDAVMGLTCLAWVHYNANTLDAAHDHYRRAAELAELAGSHYERARALTGLANTAARRDDPDSARALWSAADEIGLPVNRVVVGEGRARHLLNTNNDQPPPP
ncbi:helix-turn-helix domain-containing protein [Actinokineospora pegani]|uniref:helix-turn-helix domain-containing protein n=1 Tax=Actinokineospora pegani TaxID=2654637 RepID=UPI0012EAE23E|nr:helix-turn-helix domain-containing protein [Actinokineospora pegani]